MCTSLNVFASIEESILPLMDNIYYQDFKNKINKKQKELMEQAAKKQNEKLRIMTYNMLYNDQDAEETLLLKHRWNFRKPRLLEYLSYAKADIIGSQ